MLDRERGNCVQVIAQFSKKDFCKGMRWEFTLEFKKKIYFNGRIQIALTQPLQIIAFHARAQRKLMIRLNAFLVENE